MSQQLISRSPDLKRLQDEGYDLEVNGGHLLVKDVPYVDSRRAVRRGVLVSKLNLAGDITTSPDTHVAYFIGAHPCHGDGSKFRQIEHGSSTQTLDRDLVVNHSFSAKPASGYKDYYEKMTTYVAIISGPAQQLSPDVTARAYPVIVAAGEESVFQYVDTASSRAGISAVARRLEAKRLGIVGLGGTGSYVLDLVAKTPAQDIHLYDGDVFSQHNAFRSPGAASIEQLAAKPNKAVHFAQQYSRMHRRIIPHAVFIDESNVNELRQMSFVFLCIDGGGAKRLMIDTLVEAGVPFVDVGLGVQLDDNALGGVVRVTTSTGSYPMGAGVKGRIPFSERAADDVYATNIQVADLNALNAALAVIKWKKICGFYRDLDREHYATYTIDGNNIVNEDKP
jgi:hypothetical protein